jgi:co-chaperonin GroES (HSP10)
MQQIANFKPSNGYVLLLSIDVEESSALSVKTRIANKCKVIAVGDTVYGEFNGKNIEAPCKVNDIVYHTTIGHEDINIDGTIYRVIKFQNILGTYEK